MNISPADLRLYAVTDRFWLGNQSLAAQVDEALRAGVTIVQLREKNLSVREFSALGRELKTVADRYRVPLIINDNVEVALACEAAGVHVGQEDMVAGEVRMVLGPRRILGVSVQTVAQALVAQEQGADYLGVGAVFATSTKPDAADVSLSTLRAICQSVRIPVVAIGGIGPGNMMGLQGSGIAGVAVVSAIFASKEITAATKQLRLLVDKLTG